jgi:uncharacterized protein YkwD
MNNKLFLFLGIFVTLTASVFAQTNNFPTNLTVKYAAGDGSSRPRVAPDTGSEVKSAVIVNIGSVERTAFRMLNEKRAENGLKPLMWSDDLERVARVHSQNMADFKFFDHRGLDGQMVSDRADRLGVGNWRSIGENIAMSRGFGDPIAKAVELWLDSPSHRHNLMDENWKESAVGVAVAPDGSYYFTQVFLLRK